MVPVTLPWCCATPFSACADWTRAIQKHKQRATRNNPALSPTQVTPGHDAERQLTREKTLAHTQRLPEHGSAHLQLRETRALAKREEKTIELGAHFFVTRLLDQSSPISRYQTTPPIGSGFMLFLSELKFK